MIIATIMEYFSVRNGIKTIFEEEFYSRFSIMAEDFVGKDYFKEKLKINKALDDKDYINTKSNSHIGISIYPFNTWGVENKKSHLVFDCIEFLHRFVSKPGKWGYITNHTGWNSEDYLNYDELEGKNEFREEINILLNAFKKGYELQPDGLILYVGDETVNFIKTDFPEYNKENIGDSIRLAIHWWKNRSQTLEDKKNAILKLSSVLEYLKTDETLEKILSSKDTSDLFHIANKFALRHSNPDQKTEYDKDIWYDWIFQYYLNTCIGVLKLIDKNKIN